MHEPGSLSWAAYVAESTREDVYCAAVPHMAPFAAYWNPELRTLCWRSSHKAVTASGNYLTDWTLKTPAPELPTHCTRCRRYISSGTRHEWQKDHCKECFEHVVDGPVEIEDEESRLLTLIAAAFRWSGETFPISDAEVNSFCLSIKPPEADPTSLKRLLGRLKKDKGGEEPETEDVSIEEFEDRCARVLYREELKLKRRIKCYLYPDGRGGFEEFCTDRAWWAPSLKRPLSTPCVPGGNWTQATHVRLNKE